MKHPADINRYWTERGRTYHTEIRLTEDYHRLQQSFLVDVIKLSALPVRSILEIGCGYGRITKILAAAFPNCRITALDLSEDQLANARRYCGDSKDIVFQQYDLYSGQPLPADNFDLAIAVEVFLHHPDQAVRGFIKRVLDHAQYLASIDWCEEWQTPVSHHVWIHNYREFYKDAGLACASFVIPEKIDGKQQRLFLAGRTLPESVPRLERVLGHYTRGATEPSWDIVTQTPRGSWPENWDAALRKAVTELESVIPEGAMFILVDDGQWPVSDAFPKRRVVPFIERDGRWWGPPENDQAALHELARLREAGAEYFAYAWPSFWWTEHYAQFSQHLRQAFPCILENQRLIVFDLTA
jgi:SAM-dependent methyltransferase